MKKQLLLMGLIVLSCQLPVKAWDILHPVGSRSVSLGNCSAALSDFWATHNNPAGFATWKDISAGIYYENRFMMKELAYKNAGVLLPTNAGVLGLSVSQFGYHLYNENKIGLAFAKDFGPYLKLGLQLDYLFFKFSEDYANRAAATFEIGMQSNITETLSVGVYLFNPVHVKIRSINNDKIPIIMRLGLSYMVKSNFMITSEIEENFEKNFIYRFGLEYKAMKNFFIRTGIQIHPEIFSFGFGYQYKWLTIDISGQLHQELGASLQCSLIFRIKDKSI